MSMRGLVSIAVAAVTSTAGWVASSNYHCLWSSTKRGKVGILNMRFSQTYLTKPRQSIS